MSLIIVMKILVKQGKRELRLILKSYVRVGEEDVISDPVLHQCIMMK